MCLKHNVVINEELAEKLTPAQTDNGTATSSCLSLPPFSLSLSLFVSVFSLCLSSSNYNSQYINNDILLIIIETPEQSEERLRQLNALADGLVSQGSYHLAAMKYTQASNKIQVWIIHLISYKTKIYLVFFDDPDLACNRSFAASIHCEIIDAILTFLILRFQPSLEKLVLYMYCLCIYQ